MNVRKIREEDKEFIINNWDTMAIPEIASTLNVSERTLARWARELGMPKKQIVRKDSLPKNESKDKPRVSRAINIYVYVRKCCAICANYTNCSNFEHDKIDPCKMVCFNFEINKSLEVK